MAMDFLSQTRQTEDRGILASKFQEKKTINTEAYIQRNIFQK